MSMENINWYAKKTGLHRETVARRLEGLPSQSGPGKSTLYESTEALARLFLGDGNMKPSERDAIERARLNAARADTEEMRGRKLRGELVELDEIGKAVCQMIADARAKLLALPARVAQSLPVEPEVRRQAQQQIQTEVYAALDELAEGKLHD